MTRLFYRAALAALIAPLALGLAACGKEGDSENAAPKGEPITAIAPPEGKQWVDMVTVTPQGGHLIGNPDAPLKLLEFASLTCPHCAFFSQEASAEIQSRYVASGVVSYELRNQIHDGIDLTLNLLVRCSGPEAYLPLSEQVWANLEDIVKIIQANGQRIEAAMKQSDQTTRYKAIADATGLTDFFAARGISSDQAATCLAKPGVAESLVQESNRQSEEMNVTGTPTFFLNGQMLEAKIWGELEPILQQAGAR